MNRAPSRLPAIQLLATFALASAFRAAWNTSSWLTWIAVLLFLPMAMSLFGWIASYRDAPGVTQFVCGLQALTALAYEFSLLFIRPLFVSQPSTVECPSGLRRLAVVASILLVAVSVMVLVRNLRTQEMSHQVAIVDREALTRTQRLHDSPSRAADQRPATLAEPTGTASQPERLAGWPVSRGEVPPTLLGRWVVVSMEGAALSAPMVSGYAAFGGPGTMPGMMSAGLGSAAPAMPSKSSVAPLQWIEFRNANEISSDDGRATVFDGRESEFFTGFDLTETPPRFALKFQDERFDNSWRVGIFRAERDRCPPDPQRKGRQGLHVAPSPRAVVHGRSHRVDAS